MPTLPPYPHPHAPYAQRADFWRACDDAVKHSGLTIVAFCKQENLRKGAFYAWRKRLRDADASPESAASAAPVHRAPASNDTFIEVTPASAISASANASANAASHAGAQATGLAWLAELTRLSGALHTHLAGGPQ